VKVWSAAEKPLLVRGDNKRGKKKNRLLKKTRDLGRSPLSKKGKIKSKEGEGALQKKQKQIKYSQCETSTTVCSRIKSVTGEGTIQVISN